MRISDWSSDVCSSDLFDVNPDPVIGSFVIRNAERATTYGAEVEARFKALKGLELFANAGLLATKVNRYDDPTVQGNDLPRSPAFTLNTGFDGTPVVGEIGRDHVGTQVTTAQHV